MKYLLIGAVVMGAMTAKLPAQTNSSETVVVLSPGRFVLLTLPWGPDDSCGRPPGDGKFPSWGYTCDPLYAGWSSRSSAPGIAIATPQAVAPPAPAPPPAQPPPPAPHVESQVHEYHWPASGSDSGATTFSIVSKDGRVEFATAVWVQDDTLCYVKVDGGDGRAPIASIDRRATSERNARQQQELRLPAED